MAESPLRRELRLPDGVGDGAPVAVLLHGRGADRHDLPGLAPHLPAGTALVAPEAPHPGGPWGYGGGWAWYRYLAEDRVAPDTLAASLDALDAFLDALPDVLGFAPGPLVLGGFSQGGTASLAYALTRPGRVDGVVVLSGFLADAPGVLELTAAGRPDAPPDAAGAPNHGPVLAGTPVFWGHGTADPAIPHALGERGRTRLRALGVDVTTWDGPIGHQISGDELRALRDWMGDRGLAPTAPPPPDAPAAG
jgi:phospholipase/carboxylesterase